MSAGYTLWRVGTDTINFEAHDLSGRGAQLSGGRWNCVGTPMVYCSSSRALACLEVLTQAARRPLPIKHYLIEITVPILAWENAVEIDTKRLSQWNANPAHPSSMEWGTTWANSGASLLARVPSVLVPEEFNVLINPAHTDINATRARKVRQWFASAAQSESP